jgi:sphingomyelin phosphodiesterase acid-like 3
MARTLIQNWIFASCCVLVALPAAQSARAQAPPATVTALMVSDIHFEPFWDPAKVAQLAAAPATQWSAILAAPDSSDRAQRFAELQNACHAKGTDTSYQLLHSSLSAMRAHAAGAVFITLSGDLMAHDFSCKFHTLFPQGTIAEYESFAVKTVAFSELELHDSFPHAVLFTALGNNDSDCGDYQLDAHGPFLSQVGADIAPHLGVSQAEQTQVLHTFAATGDYNVPMSPPLEHTHFIVLDNLFMSKRYATCASMPDPKPAADQITWLRDQLETARREHQKVWFMAHIPPGVDPYSTARKMRDVCGGEKAEMFLSSDALAATLADFGDVIRLAIFAHTHMDELRLLDPAASASAAHLPVAVKMVSSISPVDGNNPSFTVARVNAATAELTDYDVYAASNQTGVDTTWSREYDFADTYHEPAFTASTVADLIAGFRADKTAQTPASQAYLRDYFVGDRSALLKPFWPQYVCALANSTSEAYRSCVCSSGK